MATVTKEWTNGDLLTLITSAGGIAVTSAENLTGADREMTIRVQTTNQGTKAFQDVLIKQEKWAIEIPQDGYWVHKDTDVVTYFGADASFIVDGVMGRPDWIVNAKEIQLCTGITEFATETITIVDPEWGDYSYEATSSFVESYDSDGNPFNTILEILRFGEASVQEVTLYLVQPYYDENYEAVTSLTEVYLNDSVTTLGEYAFDGCTSLATIDLPSATTIGRSAFNDCTSLTTIDLPSATTIGESAFRGCTSLATIDLPSATTIGYEAFYYCTSLTTIDLPSVITLDEYVFENTTGLQIVDIGTFVVNMGEYPFYDTPALSILYIRAATPPEGDWRDSLIVPTPSGLKIKVPSTSVDSYKSVVGATWKNSIEAI